VGEQLTYLRGEVIRKVEDNMIEKVLSVQANVDRLKGDMDKQCDRVNGLADEKRRELDDTYK
jgi:hypothetical protein